MHNEQDLKNTPEYRSGMFRIVFCPVCGHPTLDMYWICAHWAGNMTTSCKRRTRNLPATACPCGHTANCIKSEERVWREWEKTAGLQICTQEIFR